MFIERGVTYIDGILAGGIRDGKYGVGVILAEKPLRAVGVFTKNRVKAAPVKLTSSMLNNGVECVVVNSGNANAFTGKRGEEMCIRDRN